MRIGFLIIFITLMSGCSSQGLLTERQAFDAVRTFEGDQHLQLKNHGLEAENDGFAPSGKSHIYYLAEKLNPDPGNLWDVDAVTGEVVGAFYASRIPTTESKSPHGTYTQTQCRQIALEFARAKYTNFDNLGFQLIYDEWGKTGWSFGWQQFTAYGAESPNLVNIDISSVTGQVQIYACKRYPVYNPQQSPSITSQQSITLAAQAVGVVNIIENHTPRLYANRTTLYWLVRIVGEDKTSDIVDAAVELDAYTGSIIKRSVPGGMMSVPKATKKSTTKLKSDERNVKSQTKKKIYP